MVARAVARYIRVSPRKVRQVIDLIRGEDTGKALSILSGLNKGATHYVERVLKSAISNAEKKLNHKSPKLHISKITADGGPTLKRFRAAPMGRAVVIRKRTCHIRVELDRTKG